MTMDSITKGIVNTWKTSTGWAITLIIVIILSISLIPGVSLSGISTFGIFLIALQALEFTKEQSKEWRRKDALSHCYEAESIYNEIKPTIDKITNASLHENKKEEVLKISGYPGYLVDFLLSQEGLNSLPQRISWLTVRQGPRLARHRPAGTMAHTIDR